MALHILKLCVGADSVEDLTDWQVSQRHRWPAGRATHVTRMFPRREAEILDGGSLYWVVRGVILCRQRILALEQVTEGDGISRCALHLDASVVRTEAAARRPFQGWRYLLPQDAPRDLVQGRPREDTLPLEMAQALAEMGLR